VVHFRQSWEFQKALCGVLGLNPSQVSRIVIDAQPSGPVRVRVSAYLTITQEEALIRHFEVTDRQEVGLGAEA
jgi:DNA-binding transcriptional regulator LsrR (DeoR family)